MNDVMTPKPFVHYQPYELGGSRKGICGAVMDLDNAMVQIALDLVGCPLCLEQMQQHPPTTYRVNGVSGEGPYPLSEAQEAILEKYRAESAQQSTTVMPDIFFGGRVVTGDDLLKASAESPRPLDYIEVDGQMIDPNSLFQPEPAKRIPDEYTLLRIGAEMPEGKADKHAIAIHLQEQKRNYEMYSKEALVEELLRRDENMIRKGQEAADGRTAGRLLREFVRGILYQADSADLSAIDRGLRNSEPIDRILGLLGAESTPQRDLRMNGGTMLGKIGPAPDTRTEKEKIEDPGASRQLPSKEAADSIRKHRDERLDFLNRIAPPTPGDDDQPF